jgi:uncharacterized protein (DUF433 family)
MQPFNMGEQLADLYLEWVNNYLTVEKFAEHYQLTEEDALNILNYGRRYHAKRVERYE